MSTIEERDDEWKEGCERYPLQFAAWTWQPFSFAYGAICYRLLAPLDRNLFGNPSSKIVAVFQRAVILIAAVAIFVFTGPVALIILTPTLAFVSLMCRATGIALQKQNFSYFQGTAPEKEWDGSCKMLFWNVRGHPGSASLPEGGVPSWRGRFDAICATLKEEDPDVIVLTEVYDTSFVHALQSALQDRYAHCFAHHEIGVFSHSTGMVVFSKYPVSHFSCERAQNPSSYPKGHCVLELNHLRIVGASMPEETGAKPFRQGQFSKILELLRDRKNPLPTLFAGNGHDVSARSVYPAYRGTESTHDPSLTERWGNAKGTDCQDGIALYKRDSSLPTTERNIEVTDCHLTGGTASDHQAVVATVSIQ